MSRRPTPPRGVLKLPRQLQKELNLNLDDSTRSKKYDKRGGTFDRKHRRQTDRAAKQVKRTGRLSVGQSRRLGSAPGRGNKETHHDDEGEEASAEDEQNQSDEKIIRHAKGAKSRTGGQTLPEMENGRVKPKSILKVPVTKATSSTPAGSSGVEAEERSLSQELVLDRSSRTFLDRTAQDDAEISALEKKLGMTKTKKLPKSFDEDGLGDLLQGVNDNHGEEGLKRKWDEQEWLESKRRKTEVATKDEVDVDEDSDSDHGNESPLRIRALSKNLQESADSSEDEFNGFETENKKAEQVPPRPKRENPYVAPVSDDMRPPKYIPPSLRKPTATEAESSHRLQRQIQGLLNKLSEANLLSILGEVEHLYQTNARQDVTTALIDLLLSLFCDPSLLQNTFVILHAAFVAAIYKVIGADFGAQMVSQLVERFEQFHKPIDAQGGKQCVNLISFLAHLYTFHVVTCKLVFDHIRSLLETLSEANAELLLRVVRDSGPQLRQDDPLSLKDIVLRMQNASAKAQGEGHTISVRTKFMIETIVDLKNNKLKTQITSSGVSSEHITRLRKSLGTLNSRSLRGSEPLRIGIADLKNAERRGKWWLVGASWKEEDKLENPYSVDDERQDYGNQDILENGEEDLIILARQHRMNTVVRRAIFIAIMSATDYKDAHLRLLKLRLKRSQEQEIPRVLMHCACAEDKYNPYYSLIAKTLCADRRLMMAFQFSLWDFFRRMGDRGDDLDSDDEDRNDGDGDGVDLKAVVNTAKMIGHLIVEGSLSLGILKTLNLFLVQEQARMFVEVLLIVVILRSQEGGKDRGEGRLAAVFAKCRDSPQLVTGLRHFLKTVVRETDLVSSKAEGALVKWGSRVAIDTLRIVSSGSDEKH